MPKKKKDQPEKEILEGEIIEGEIAAGEADRPHSETDHPIDDQDQPEEGAVISEDELPLEERFELIKAALEASESKAEEYLDGWQRSRAEFTNFR